MEKHVQKYVDDFMADIIARNPGEKEFHQAVHEVVESLAPYPILRMRLSADSGLTPPDASGTCCEGSSES